MRLFGLIGHPLSHSFSKKYFTEKFEKEQLTGCRFENFPIASVDELPQILDTNPELEGLAVTIPYKQSVLKYLDASNIPDGLAACNCIRVEGKKLTGYNTDHSGFEKSIAPLLKPHHNRALILGNGGATASVSFVLKKLGIGFDIVSRTIHDGSTLTYADIDERVMKEHTVIINTTPLGMYPVVNERPSILYSNITKDHLLYDLIYNPEKTLFLQKGEMRGAAIKNGEEMLVIQAEENWKIWNGVGV
ncbi:MAG TPA: shikimate dehydrogenase [Chitinophagaceae bacterium]|nr:shikimate dehydrogenase [Chitinophagaceae bacterium]